MVGKKTVVTLIPNERRSAMITPLPDDMREWKHWFFKRLFDSYQEDKTLINRAYEVGGEQAMRKVYQMIHEHKTDEEVKAYVKGIM